MESVSLPDVRPTGTPGSTMHEPEIEEMPGVVIICGPTIILNSDDLAGGGQEDLGHPPN
ncbi:MAG TPA: hypothetical protein VE621_15555 [Bryobacteraceae bacterium]|nr:hypothetical protein [Bryobacteraceae bacterium]